jgi:hypothetical protein
LSEKSGGVAYASPHPEEALSEKLGGAGVSVRRGLEKGGVEAATSGCAAQSGMGLGMRSGGSLCAVCEEGEA